MKIQAEWIGQQAKSAAADWWKIQIQDPSVSVYLYFQVGELRAATHPPAGFELVTGERMSPASTLEQQQKWILSQVRRTPFLPPFI